MEPVFIAEIGLNHGGSLSKAFRMVYLAKLSGATVAKFQHYSPIDVLGIDHPALDYVVKCQFKRQDHERLAQYCNTIGIEYLVSVFDIKDIQWAASLCKRMKVASRKNQDLEFLSYIDKTKLPVIMSIQPEVPLRSYYRDRFYFMWCVRNYPATTTEVLNTNFSYKYGLSSHCPDFKASVEAYKLGARIFENHVKEFETEEGCDMASSITFDNYKRMTSEIESIDNSAERQGTLSSGL